MLAMSMINATTCPIWRLLAADTSTMAHASHSCTSAMPCHHRTCTVNRPPLQIGGANHPCARPRSLNPKARALDCPPCAPSPPSTIHRCHYNTLGVCHQLSIGFELKHDMLSGDEGVKIKSTRVSSNLNLDNTPLLTYVLLLRLCKSNVKHAYFMYITSTCIHLDQWKCFMQFGIKKSHEMISYNLSWIGLLSEWNYRSSTKPC